MIVHVQFIKQKPVHLYLRFWQSAVPQPTMKTALLGSLTCLATIILMGCTQQPSRDMSKYQLIGPYPHLRGDAQELHEIRTFLWSNWNKKAEAHVHVVFVNKHGQRTPTDFYIEQDASGRWGLLARSEVPEASWKDGKVIHSTRLRKVFWSRLERVKWTGTSHELISPSVIDAPPGHQLRFIDGQERKEALL